MSGCNFISKLNKLRKSSSDSIDNVDSFDGFKEYMHVVRDAEKDLKAVLRQVNVGTKKTLVLLCGSAGDGKSHLLSYLKNSDTENLLENYIIHNDGRPMEEACYVAKDMVDFIRKICDLTSFIFNYIYTY